MSWRVTSAVILLTLAATAAWATEPPLFPDVTLVPFSSEGGGPIALESFRGRPVLLTFWASWCGPCRWELPEFQQLYNELAEKGLVFVTVTMDQSNTAALRFLDSARLAIPVYRMGDRDLARLRVRAIPTSFLIRPDGRADQLYQGYAPNVADDIRQRVLAMLAEPEEGSP